MGNTNKIAADGAPSDRSTNSGQEQSSQSATNGRVSHPELPSNQQPSQTVASEESEEEPDLIEANKLSEKLHKKWNRRMRFLFCCIRHKDNNQSIKEVASIFAEFYTHFKLSTSDTLVALLLLSKNQEAQRRWMVENPNENNLGIEQFLSGVAIKADTKFFDITRPEESHILDNLIYYSKYSLATFGYHMQAYRHPCSLCCIFPYLNRSSCCCGASRRTTRPIVDDDGRDDKAPNSGSGAINSADKRAKNKGNKSDGARRETDKRRDQFHGDWPVVLEDNCCGLNAAVAEQVLDGYNCEIIHITYKSDVHKTPFLVAADHSRRTIVVAVRGSISLSDAVTDMHYYVDRVPLENCPEDWLFHRGMGSAAAYVKTTLIQEHILERAFNCRPDLGSPNYGLVLCGHSLGAGTAVILGVLIRSMYPSLKAYLFSPPGGILSLPVVEYTKEFAISITLGYDIVARAGLPQMERLRYHALMSLKKTHRSLCGVTAHALCPSMCFARNRIDGYDPEQSVDFLFGTNEPPLDYNNAQIPFQAQPEMLFVPGRLIHIVRNYSYKPATRRHWTGPLYQAVWTENESYDRVLVEDGLFADHMPWNLDHAMMQLRSKSLPYRFGSIKSNHSSSKKESS